MMRTAYPEASLGVQSVKEQAKRARL